MNINTTSVLLFLVIIFFLNKRQILFLLLLVPQFSLKAWISVREGAVAELTCPAWVSPGCGELPTTAFPSFPTQCPQAAVPRSNFPRQLLGVGCGRRFGCPATSWNLSALFVPNPELRPLGKNRDRPTMTRGGDGDKECRRNPHQTQRERNQPSAGKGRLMGVYTLVPAKATSQKSHLPNKQCLNNPSASCPDSSGKPRSCGMPWPRFGRALSTVGSSGCRSGLMEPLRERKIFAYFSFADFAGSYSLQQ